MSLIVAQSGQNQDPAFFRNNYKDGISLKAGSEVSLVSLSFNKDPTYNILTGVNDRFRWIIGETPDYLLHEIVVPAGTYSGGELATEIQSLLQESTVLTQYVWSCTFDPDAFSGQGSFTIGYTQRPAPTEANRNSAVQQSGSNTMTFEGNGTDEIRIIGERGTNHIVNDFPITSSDNIVALKRGLFSNGGNVEFLLTPTESYTTESFDTLATETVEFNEGGSLSLHTWTIATGGASTAGWDYRLEVTPAGSLYRYLYYVPTDEGSIYMSFATTDPDLTADPTQASNIQHRFLFNDTTQDLRDAQAGSRTVAQPLNVGFVISKWNSALGQIEPMGLNKEPLGYGQNKFGYARNDIYQAGTIEPQQPDGFDLMLNVRDNANRNALLFSVSQMIQDPAIEYPNAGWRGNSSFVFQNILSSAFSTITGISPTPTNWSTFNYGVDNVTVRIELDDVFNLKVSVYHDVGGDASEQELTVIAKTGSTGTANLAYNIKEFMYPLRACMSIGAGGRYEAKDMLVDGFFDEKEITQTALNDNVQPTERLTGVPDTEPAQFVMGALNSTQIGTGDDQVPADEAPVPLDKFNINKTLGMKTLYTFQEGEESNSFSSDQAVALSIREEAILVEITDFNIQGYNGGTGDTLKIVAVCPREELTTNTQDGTINYNANFPIFVDLNLINDQKTYDLNVALRNLNGELVKDILPNTVATFLVREKEEVKQKRIMREQMEMMSGIRASQNQNAISQLGRM